MMQYDLIHNGKKVGFVGVEKQGLFYKIGCRFSGVSDSNPHLMVTCEGRETDLGVCVPCGTEWEIQRCLPIKNLGVGELHFFVGSVREKGLFIPICSNMPFREIDKLINARFAVRWGKEGILLDNKGKVNQQI